ncbi:MAG: tyrosine-type recombinase/integrase, partial [Bacillota bacterium]
MGHLEKKGKKKYKIVIEAGKDPVTGKRKRIHKTVNTTKRKAKKIMAKMQTKIDQGNYIKPSDIKLEKYLKKWLKEYCEPNLAPKTYQDYKGIIKNHLIPSLGQLKLKEIKPVHIITYQNKKLKDGRLKGKGGLSKRTVQYHHSVISEALKHAVIHYQLIQHNPCSSVPAPTPNKKEINPLSKEQIIKILENAEEDWLHDIIYVAVFTGMRRGELCGLRWKDINFNNMKIYVKQAAKEITGKGVIYDKPKTESSLRPIDVDQDVIKILKNRKDKKNKNKKKNKKNNEQYIASNLVFTLENGAPVRPDFVTKKFKEIVEEIGMEDYRFHDL